MRLLENLTILMKEKNINRSQLAKEIGIAPSTVNSWFNRNCDNITLSTLVKLSNYFNITMEELINGVPAPSVTFYEIDYSSSELDILRKFGDFLKDNRSNYNQGIEILPFSELEKETEKRRRLKKTI